MSKKFLCSTVFLLFITSGASAQSADEEESAETAMASAEKREAQSPHHFTSPDAAGLSPMPSSGRTFSTMPSKRFLTEPRLISCRSSFAYCKASARAELFKRGDLGARRFEILFFYIYILASL